MLQEIGNGSQFLGEQDITYTTSGEYTINLLAKGFRFNRGGSLQLSIKPPLPDKLFQELLNKIGVCEDPDIIKIEPDQTTLIFCLEPDDTQTIFGHSFVAS